jgi:CRP-like cAMP-binding protein
MLHSVEIKPEESHYGSVARRALGRFGPLRSADETRIRAAIEHSEAQPVWSQLLGEGEPIECPRILLAGWAARVRWLRDGRRQILGFFLPGDIFDLSFAPRAVGVTPIMSLTRVVFARFPIVAAWVEANDEEDSFTIAFREYLRLEQSYLMNQLVRVGRLTAYERMAHLLLEFYYRLRAMGFFHGNGYVLPLTQEVLADALALSPVHTNRTLQQLRRDGLIETRGTTVRLLDLPRLGEIADFTWPFGPKPDRGF